MTHVPWTDIEAFHNVRKNVLRYPELLGSSNIVRYRAKVKLHGTNAGIRIDPNGTVTAFSRTNVITPTSDNVGFAAWVKNTIEPYVNVDRLARPVVFYGEWCGPGIQKGVAVNQIPQRTFAVFAARYVDYVEGDDTLLSQPQALEALFQTVVRGLCDASVKIIPWDSDESYDIDWSLPSEQLQPVLDRINDRVAQVEACDPWTKQTFGIEGTGEGLVFYPVDEAHGGYRNFSNLCFKAKGDKHKVVAKERPAQLDPAVAQGLDDFSQMVLTPARLEQGVRAVNSGELQFELRNVGAFLAWISKDIIKETTAQMEASGLDQKKAVQACSNRARAWYLEQAKKP